MQRKTRTREHVIASQSVAHMEKHIAAAGCTSERFANDYGYDLNLHTYGSRGQIESGNVYLQLKATDALKVLRGGTTISFPVNVEDVALWRNEVMPVILIVYDASQDLAYWLYLQEFFETSPRFQKPLQQKQIMVHFNKSNVVNREAIERFRHFKQIVLEQLEGKVRHYG